MGKVLQRIVRRKKLNGKEKEEMTVKSHKKETMEKITKVEISFYITRLKKGTSENKMMHGYMRRMSWEKDYERW